MKYIASLLLIMSFVGMSIFSFAIFDHDMNSSNNSCIASIIDGTVCPMSITGMILHHISALKTFITTVPSISNWLLLLVFLLFIPVSIFPFYKNLLFPRAKSLSQRLRDLTFNFLYSKQKIVSWLSLFELSPAL